MSTSDEIPADGADHNPGRTVEIAPAPLPIPGTMDGHASPALLLEAAARPAGAAAPRLPPRRETEGAAGARHHRHLAAALDHRRSIPSAGRRPDRACQGR